MSYRPQYYDSNIYMQSTNLILKAADLYYNQGMRQQEISEISRSLKALARELQVPVIALSQLSRAVEQRPEHRPMLKHLPD